MPTALTSTVYCAVQNGGFVGQHVCTASLALTMLLMLKCYLKATYAMSEERISAFSPDIPDKRKQVGPVATTCPLFFVLTVTS